MRFTRIVATSAILLRSTCLAIPVFELFDKREQTTCASGSQVCASFCCLPGTHCVQDLSTPSGFNCVNNPEGGGPMGPITYADGSGWMVYMTTYVITEQEVKTVVSTVSSWIPARATGGGGQTPGATPGATPGGGGGGGGVYPGGGTGVLQPPSQPTDGEGQKVYYSGYPGATGTYLYPVPTGNATVPGYGAIGGGGSWQNVGLTPAQIAGITGGIIGGIALLGLLCFWCVVYGLCAACGLVRKRRHGSDTSSSSYESHRRHSSWIPGGFLGKLGLGMGAAALAGTAAGHHTHGSGHHTTYVTEKKKSGFGKGAMIGSLGALWLYQRMKKKNEKASGYGGAAGYYKPGHSRYSATHTSESSYESSSSSSSSGGSSSSSSSSTTISHSSSSSGVRTVD